MLFQRLINKFAASCFKNASFLINCVSKYMCSYHIDLKTSIQTVVPTARSYLVLIEPDAAEEAKITTPEEEPDESLMVESSDDKVTDENVENEMHFSEVEANTEDIQFGKLSVLQLGKAKDLQRGCRIKPVFF